MLDMVMGIDIHIVNIPTPGGPVPTPLPHPFIGMLFDPTQYIPMIGSTVWINGQPGAHAGMEGKAMPPHIPMGAGFTRGMVGNACEQFMGSATVLLEWEPLARMGDITMSCSCIGMMPPPRKKDKSADTDLMTPTSSLLVIPGGQLVMVGGPPIISMMGVAMKGLGKVMGGLGKGLRKLQQNSKMMKKVSEMIHDAAAKVMKNVPDKVKNKVHKAICTVTGHPVDVVTGKVFTDHVDFTLPGPIPLVWERTYFTTSQHMGPLGYGWHHPYDMSFEFDKAADAILIRLNDGREIYFPYITGEESAYNKQEKLTLSRSGDRYVLSENSGLSYHFQRPLPKRQPVQPVRKISNEAGQEINFRYSKDGYLTQIIDSSEREIEIVNDDYGRIKHVLLPHPEKNGENFKIVSYKYDASGNLWKATDAMGEYFEFLYEHHLLIKETNRNGLSFHFEYDGDTNDARCIRTWGDDGIYDHKLIYDLENKKTTVVNSLGAKTQHFWNDSGLVVKTIDALGGISTKEYDEALNLLSEEDELGLITKYAYDEQGNVTQILYPDESKVDMAYENNRLVKAIDQVGGQWQWSYNDKGQLTSRTNPLGETYQYEYDKDLLSVITNPLQGQTQLLYDKSRNLTHLMTADGEESQWVYDNLGRVVEALDPNENSRKIKYQFNGLVRQVNEPDGNVRKLQYDGEENVIKVEDKHRTVRFEYGGFNKMKARVEAETRVEFKYNTEEDLLGIINEHGYAYRFARDAKGLVVTESGFDGLKRKYKRDAAGRVIRVERPGKRFSNYNYDPMGQIEVVLHYDGSGEAFGYRADGQLVSAINADVAVSFDRDILGRITEERQGSFSVQSRYDKLGRRIAVTSSLGADIKISRNIMGDVEEVVAMQDTAEWQAQFKRDNFGLETERLLPGGVRSTWERDKLGRPVKQQTFAGGGEKTRSRKYKWDVNYRLKQIEDEAKGTWIFQHDVFGNLAGASYPDGTEELKMPDAVGNLFRSKSQKDRKYGPAGQLLEANGSHYEYDVEGNMDKKTTATGDVWQYEWNASGMMSAVVRPDGDRVEFAYDALGRRISKSYREKTTYWVWDGNFMLHEWSENAGGKGDNQEGLPTQDFYKTLDNKDVFLLAQSANGPPNKFIPEINHPITTWVFEPESFAPLAKLEDTTQHSIVSDHLGTPVHMYAASGEKSWEADLSIYGNVRNMQGGKEACPFRYPGQYEDVETGLYYNRFRYFDPESGGYVSQDPIGLAGGMPNEYSYVSDCMLQFDPFGLECWATSRKKFWKNEAKTNPNKYSNANRKRMENGNAPRMTVEVTNRKTGKTSTKDYSMELHHRDVPQRVGGEGVHDHSNLDALTPWEHEEVDPFRHVGSDLEEVILGVDKWGD